MIRPSVSRKISPRARSGRRGPIERFRELFARAAATEPSDHTAVALATADATGAPSVRMVLLKGVDHRGFVFFTNYGSRKARDLDANPRAALCFHWPALGVQVRVEGRVTRVPAAESDAYFTTRPRESQVAAWASDQSAPLPSRRALLARWARTEGRLPTPAPRPEFWGGYRIVPARIEFWRSEPHRLHRRTLYVRTARSWRRGLLYP
jgi:pyridoxamine 5'-phosphate oxidase